MDYSCVSGRSAETPTSLSFITSTFPPQLTDWANCPETGSSERPRCEWLNAAAHSSPESQSIDHAASPGALIWASCLISTLSVDSKREKADGQRYNKSNAERNFALNGYFSLFCIIWTADNVITRDILIIKLPTSKRERVAEDDNESLQSYVAQQQIELKHQDMEVLIMAWCLVVAESYMITDCGRVKKQQGRSLFTKFQGH